MLNGVAASDSEFKSITPTVRGADLAVANLEIPLTTSRAATSNKSAEEIRRRDQFILKGDPQHIPNIAKAGWNLVSLANNHAMDYGEGGLFQMQALLRKWGIGYAGAGENEEIAQRPAVFRSKQGFRIALVTAIAFVTWPALKKVTPAGANSTGVHALYLRGMLDEDARLELTSWISAARRVSDFVIVGFHWGTERKPIPNGYQVALGRMAVDCGADVVWGHHPHVLQGAEIYDQKPIFYSLGNLISPTPADSAVMRLNYDRGDLRSLEVFPTSISGGRVTLKQGASRKTALSSLKSLCTEVQRRFPSPSSVSAFR